MPPNPPASSCAQRLWYCWPWETPSSACAMPSVVEGAGFPISGASHQALPHAFSVSSCKLLSNSS